MMHTLTISLLLMALMAASCLDDVVIGPDEAAFNRQRCFEDQHVFCECANPGTDAEARYCNEQGL